MNFPFNNITRSAFALAAVATLATHSNAAVIVGAAPTTGVLYDGISGTTNSNIIIESVNPGNHGRADSFTLGTTTLGTFDITSVTLAKNGNQTFDGDSVTVFIATGGATQWVNGTGHTTAEDGTDYLVDTGMTLQVQEVFTLTGAITNADFITFEFASPVTVADDTEYTVGWVYNQGSGPDRLGYDENNSGGRLSVSDGAYGAPGIRGISFSVQGIPEPSVALLGGLGLLGLLRRRRA